MKYDLDDIDEYDRKEIIKLVRKWHFCSDNCNCQTPAFDRIIRCTIMVMCEDFHRRVKKNVPSSSKRRV